MSSSAATSRASALASAALASSRSGARASRFAPLSRRRNEGAGLHGHDPDSSYASTSYGPEMLEMDADLSSRQKRLSRAARYGATNSSQEPIRLPAAWNAVVSELLNREGNAELRRDYVRNQQGLRPGTLTPQRSNELHLTTASPKRYAAAQTVLRQVRNRLGPDNEADTASVEGWTPATIAEYGTGAGEGLWACAEVFGGKRDSRLRYEGYEGVRPWQRVTQDIIASAKQLSLDKQIPTDPILAALDGMKISFQPVVQVSDLNDSSKTSASKTKLVFCNHYLSALRSDAARSDFVNSLWIRHPDAEVLAFVEEGSQRGFACIASAREELLGIGRRSAAAKEAGQDGVTADLVGHQACYVVAPCPHDRPCPLLHDFELDATVNASLGKTVQSSSPMFHGASTGLVTCTSPLRVQNPSYTRLTRGTARANDFVQHSYLIVRRGDRPNFKSAAQSMAQNPDQALSIFATLQEQAAKTKEGIIDALRQSRSTVRDIPLAEIVSEEGQSVDPEDKDAQAELLRMLPDILRQQQGLDMTSNEQDIDHATRLAQNIMEQSADLAAAAQTEPSEQERMEADSVNLSAALLDQQRSMDSTEEEGLGDPSPVEGLSTEELQSMRTESFEWPRLVRTPMKKGGHVIFDACTAQASIDRFTLTRSMGRQTYQDARKAAHGDLLPYVPLTEQPTFTEDTSSDQADNFETMTHIQNVKALINSVPAADVSRRNAMPPSAKISRSAGRRASNKRQFPWPASSAQAIGADLIAGGEAESDVESTGTALARRSTADSFTRRTHYKDGKGRGAEQLRSANVYTPRENRKRSMESYGEEALQGWTMPDEGVQEHDQEPEQEVFRS